MEVFFSAPCAQCGKPIWRGDERCEACGEVVSAARQAELQARVLPTAYHKQSRLIRSGRSALGYVMLGSGVGGIVLFFFQRSTAAPILKKLEGMDAHTQLNQAVAGAASVGDLRDAMEHQPWEALLINLTVAALMLRSSKRLSQAPGSALLAAFWIYLAACALSLCLFSCNTAPDLFFIALKLYILVTLARGARAGLSLQRSTRVANTT